MEFKELVSLLEETKEKIVASANAKATEQYKAIEASFAKIKGLPEGVTGEELLKLKADFETQVAAFDALQAKVKSIGTNAPAKAPESFNEVLQKALVEKTDDIAKMHKKELKSVSLELKAVGDMTFSNNFSTANTSTAFVNPNIIQLPKRKLHIRDLLTGGSMGTASTFNYVKEVAGEGSIATVAEGASKAQIDLDLVEAQVPAQWIAGYLRISRNMLDDVIGMSTFLNSRLPELLLRTEDNQLLNGNGTSPNISGITHSGNFTAPTSGGSTIDVEQLVEAIAQLEGYDREANGILIHPSDYYRILLNKAGGSEEYDLPGLVQIVNGQLYVGGVPVYRSTAATVDKFIVGDWAMGASLITREPVRIEIFEQDGTNVRENKLTVRIEERIAFPIYGDNYFIYGDFGNVS
jgi:HK97 family phage major capsid protein